MYWQLCFSESAISLLFGTHSWYWALHAGRLASPHGRLGRIHNYPWSVGQILASAVAQSQFTHLALLETGWHALQKLNLPYKILTSYIPMQHGTFESRYAQLYLAFIASAFIHHLGALNVTSSSPENDWLSLLFFLIQPISIMLEDLAIYVGKKAGVKSSCRWSAS